MIEPLPINNFDICHFSFFSVIITTARNEPESTECLTVRSEQATRVDAWCNFCPERKGLVGCSAREAIYRARQINHLSRAWKLVKLAHFIVGETGPFIVGEIGPFIFLQSTSYRSAHQWIEFEPVLKPEFITTSTRDMFQIVEEN